MLVSAATTIQTTTGIRNLAALTEGNFYVHLVGYPANSGLGPNVTGAQRVPTLVVPTAPPPDFTATSGLPTRALPLKAVYDAIETGNVRVPRFDLAREHELRVIKLTASAQALCPPGLTAQQKETLGCTEGSNPNGARSLTVPNAVIREEDSVFEFFASLIGEFPATRGPVAYPNQPFVLRIGTDERGLDCELSYDVSNQRITGSCSDEQINDILDGGDVAYLALLLGGNASNVIWQTNLTIPPQPAALTVNTVQPGQLIFPVRNFRNQKSRPVPETAQTSPVVGTAPLPGACPVEPWQPDDGPVQVTGTARVTINRAGRLKIELLTGAAASPGSTVAPVEIATYDVWTSAGAISRFEQVPSTELLYPLTKTGPNTLQVAIPPGAPKNEKVKVTFTPRRSRNGDPTFADDDFETKIVDQGVMPIGQTMVKDVNIATGALVKQFQDFSYSGRSGALQFSRTYGSSSSESSPLGQGWNHSHRIYLSAPSTPNRRKYIVVGCGSFG